MTYISIDRKGNEDDFNNHRGISATSAISRVFGNKLLHLIKRLTPRDEAEQSSIELNFGCYNSLTIKSSLPMIWRISNS